MNDEQFGHRDKRGYWKPDGRIEYPPAFVWPAQPVRFFKWMFGIPGYILPWNAFYLGVTLAVWFFLTPAIETLQNISAGWIAYLLFRNALLVLLFVGAWHLRLYIQQSQGTRFKFNENWPPRKNPAFLFKSQTADNMVWTFASAVPIWTAYEVLTLWAFANGYIPWLQWSDSPVYFVVLLLLVPLIRDIHFYAIHRLIHWPPLYRLAHSLHHKNINPGPWSGLAMHPIEHLFYFSGVLVHFVIASHPVHALFHLVHAGLSPAQGHVGFDRVVLGNEAAMNTHSYAHYLHHRYFNCNYADGTVPLDKWLGTFHDGSEESHRKMLERLQEK
jgi:sterol desaturase/sphingolipid hydroxylase (fatty acid hydroxylase superfamily)